MQNRAAQLDKQIKVLIDDSVALLKARMSELGINATSPVDLLAKAKEIVCRHKDLQAQASKLQVQVVGMEQDQKTLVAQRQHEIAEKYNIYDSKQELSPILAEEYILREISSTLSQRKKLHNQVSLLEGEVLSLEKSSEERKHAQIMAVRQQHSAPKSSRKSRDYRTRSQDWPDVPDIAKIEEQNPEILAQKILEKGRMIEASKLNSTKQPQQTSNNMKSSGHGSQRGTIRHGMHTSATFHKKARLSGNFATNNQRPQEPPRITNFEDRLKSIITSVLNEDQHNRDKNQNGHHVCSPPVTVQYSQMSQHVHPAYNTSQQYNYSNFLPKHEEKSKVKYNRCETIVKPNEDSRNCLQYQEGLASMVDCYREPEGLHISPHISNKQVTSEQPDYTQVSPAKLALRRHLSQEKLAAQHHIYSHSDGMVATRTIGDLVSGEIERTLEISNQSIINAAVDICDIQGTATLSSRSVVNANLPPRPERVHVKVPTTDMISKDPEPIIRQVYSPISRPSSTEGLEGLAYAHNHIKVNSHIVPTYISPSQPSPRQSQYSPKTTVLLNHTTSAYLQSDQYNSIARSDVKPYESYYHDVKPPVPIESENRNNFVPEGLAASLQARVLNAPLIKEEVDTYDRRNYIHTSIISNTTSYQEQTGVIKTESITNDCQYKRDSPIIQGPVRHTLRQSSIYLNESQRNVFGSNTSPEPHSDMSTPLIDEVQEQTCQHKPNEEGKRCIKSNMIVSNHSVL